MLYAVGDGFSLEQAQQSALNTIAGKLTTQLSSSLERVTQDSGQLTSDSVRRQLHSHVSEVNLSQFETLEIQQHGRVTRVLVGLNRERLADIWTTQINDNLDYLVPLLSSTNDHNFSAWLTLQQATSLAQKTRGITLSLQALDGTPPGPNIERAIEQKLKDYDLSIEVTGPITEVNRAITQQLNQHGIQACSHQCQIRITHQPELERHHMFGEYVSALRLNIQLSEGHRIINQHSIEQRATSVVSENAADRNVAMITARQITDVGLWKLLGMNF